MSADTDRLIAQARNSAGHLYSAEMLALADALEAAEAQRDTLAESLREAADKFSVIRRCAINSRSAPNVFDTIYDVATWARDAALAAVAPPEEQP